MSVKKIDHVGIAVKSIEEWLPYYRDTLGLEYLGSEEVQEQMVRVAFLKIGESRIELLEPTSAESPIAKFLEKQGGGIHHIAVLVDDIKDAIHRHHEHGQELINKEPRVGAHDMKIAFVHPKATGRVLLELCQEPD
jgi:methylmalonyl-CoA/ethylmalonyl-CoA epimerase